MIDRNSYLLSGRIGQTVDLVKKNFNILRIILYVFILAVSVFFGFKKQGFYIDEYYIYCHANGTQTGMDINAGKWNDTDRYVRLLVSEGEENFSFRQTYETERNGTHPPLYYYLVHFVSSIFSGVFSKWIGLSVNIAILIPMLILVDRIAWKLSDNEAVTLVTILLFGLSTSTISMTMLIRMYLLLALWTVWYAYIHVMDLERDHLSVSKFLLPVFLCGFFGFLTQYFFVIIMFFVSFVYAFYLLVSCRRIKDVFIYGATALISLICTYFPWPISFFHIFKGPRGKGAFSQARNLSDFIHRLGVHLGYMNKMLFGGLLPVFVVLLAIGVFLIVRRCIEIKNLSGTPVLTKLSIPTRGFIMLGLASVFNFLVLSQLSLMDGIACFRYSYTSYVLFMILLPVGLYRLAGFFLKKSEKSGYVLMLTGVLAILILGFAQRRVLFLYENEKEAITFAMEHPDEKVIMFECDDGNYDSMMQQMIMYPRVFFALADDPETAKDDEIAGADELLVYMSKSAEDKDACFDSIYSQNPNITKTEHLWDFDFFSVYLMN